MLLFKLNAVIAAARLPLHASTSRVALLVVVIGCLASIQPSSAAQPDFRALSTVQCRIYCRAAGLDNRAAGKDQKD